MKTKIESKLIDAFPICDEGKIALRELLGSMGFEIEAKVPKRKPGQIFRGKGSNRLAILTGKSYIYLDNGEFNTFDNPTFEFVANSFDEYLKSRGEL